MKTLTTAIVLSLAAFGVSAQNLTLPMNDHYGTPKTRAEVSAELIAAIADRSIVNQADVNMFADLGHSVSVRSRAEVRQELIAALARHDTITLAEPYLARTARREVMADRQVSSAAMLK